MIFRQLLLSSCVGDSWECLGVHDQIQLKKKRGFILFFLRKTKENIDVTFGIWTSSYFKESTHHFNFVLMYFSDGLTDSIDQSELEKISLTSLNCSRSVILICIFKSVSGISHSTDLDKKLSMFEGKFCSQLRLG